MTSKIISQPQAKTVYLCQGGEGVLPNSGTYSLEAPFGSVHHRPAQKQRKFEFPWDIPLLEGSQPLPQVQGGTVLPFSFARPAARDETHSAFGCSPSDQANTVFSQLCGLLREKDNVFHKGIL